MGKIIVPSGEVEYADKKIQEGDLSMVVRTIIETPFNSHNQRLKRCLSNDYLINNPEALLVLRGLTNGRYPSFYTLSHVLGANDNFPSISLRELENKGLDLLGEEINGMSTACPYNGRAFGRCYEGKRGTYLPLFVFGTNNTRFNQFVREKYAEVFRSESVESLVAKGRMVKVASEITESKDFLEGDPIVSLIKKIETESGNQFSHLYANGWGWNNYRGFHNDEERNIESDFICYHNLPMYEESCDGSYITTRGKVRGWNATAMGLHWNDAEMMIDMFGLFDGKQKIIFFKANQKEGVK